MPEITNSDKQKILRYTALTFRAERDELSSEEKREKKRIFSELAASLGLSHGEIIEFAAKNLVDGSC